MRLVYGGMAECSERDFYIESEGFILFLTSVF